jgi:enolase-phosphatase E1
MTAITAKTRAVLLDIEGTVTPISFVHEVLFPFARNHVREFLVQHLKRPEVQTDVTALVREHAADAERSEQTRPIDAESIDSIIDYVNWLIERDRKSPALKSLQGKIWEEGYRDGSLKAPLFDDVVPNLQRLRANNFQVAIFSSGSILAQKLLFAHTRTGDHTDLIDAYFDTGVGSKMEAGSYRRIAHELDLEAEAIVFVSDVVNELKAAREAGMKAILCVRPGNPVQPQSEEFQRIHSFSDVLTIS